MHSWYVGAWIKWSIVCGRYIQMYLLEKKGFTLWFKVDWSFSVQLNNIGSGTGLGWSRPQAITWTDVDQDIWRGIASFGSWELTLANFRLPLSSAVLKIQSPWCSFCVLLFFQMCEQLGEDQIGFKYLFKMNFDRTWSVWSYVVPTGGRQLLSPSPVIRHQVGTRPSAVRPSHVGRFRVPGGHVGYKTEWAISRQRRARSTGNPR